MFKFIQDLLTENSNNIYCIARVAFAIALLTFLGGSVYDTIVTHIFNYSAFANGVTMILASGGASIALKSIKSA